MKLRLSETLRLALFLFLLFCMKSSLSQQLYKGNISIQDKSLSAQGIPIRCNSRIVTHTSEDGSFSFYATKGDTLKIVGALYEPYSKILIEEVNYTIGLKPKITQLEDVNVNFSKDTFAEGIIRQALAKLKKVDSLSHTILLKQVAVKNNQDTLLSTEGVLNYTYVNIDSSKFEHRNISMKVSEVCVHKGLFGGYTYTSLDPKWLVFSGEYPLFLAKIYFKKKEKLDIQYTDKEVLISYTYRNKKNNITINFIIDKVSKSLIEIQETWEGKSTLVTINYNFLDNRVHKINSYSYKQYNRVVLTTKDEWRFYENVNTERKGVEWKDDVRNLQKYENKLPSGCDNIRKYKSDYNLQ